MMLFPLVCALIIVAASSGLYLAREISAGLLIGSWIIAALLLLTTTLIL